MVNPFNPKYLEWYSPCLDLEHTKQVCRGERIIINKFALSKMSKCVLPFEFYVSYFFFFFSINYN